MKIIIGLGNPGKQYELTRHNAGFLAVDFYLKDKPAITCQSKFKAQICEMHFKNEKVFFIKPQTFMNLSGQATREICDFYKVNPEQDVLVIHDEKDLKFGQIKPAKNSGAAGHNGVQNIIDELGTKNFSRIRIGVETREDNSPIPTDVFVLQKFSNEELKNLEQDVFPKAIELITKFIES